MKKPGLQLSFPGAPAPVGGHPGTTGSGTKSVLRHDIFVAFDTGEPGEHADQLVRALGSNAPATVHSTVARPRISARWPT